MRGMHAIIECYGAQAYLGATALVDLMRRAANAAGAEILQANVHEFGEGCGITGVLLLAESHISVHTWPEHGYAAFDIFMCGDHAQLDAAIASIRSYDNKSRCHTRILDRGRSDMNCSIGAMVKDSIGKAPALIDKILSNTACETQRQAEDGLAETFKFLSLCSESSHSLTPSRHVDEIWHELILFTRNYQRLCETYFSRFIHHSPSDSSLPGRDQNAYERTLMLYQQRFGEPNAHFWPGAKQLLAECGPCESH